MVVHERNYRQFSALGRVSDSTHRPFIVVTASFDSGVIDEYPPEIGEWDGVYGNDHDSNEDQGDGRDIRLRACAAYNRR